MTRRSVAKKLKLPILAKYIEYAVKGCPPQIMGIGPTVVIPELISRSKLSMKDIDIWEIN